MRILRFRRKEHMSWIFIDNNNEGGVRLRYRASYGCICELKRKGRLIYSGILYDGKITKGIGSIKRGDKLEFDMKFNKRNWVKEDMVYLEEGGDLFGRV